MIARPLEGVNSNYEFLTFPKLLRNEAPHHPGHWLGQQPGCVPQLPLLGTTHRLVSHIDLHFSSRGAKPVGARQQTSWPQALQLQLTSPGLAAAVGSAARAEGTPTRSAAPSTMR